MCSIENFQKLLDLYPSEMNGIALCQGNFTLMTDDLPAVIRKFGSKKKYFLFIFRDVQGNATDFIETFHDDGKTDMVECMRSYQEIGYQGICRIMFLLWVMIIMSIMVIQKSGDFLQSVISKESGKQFMDLN